MAEAIDLETRQWAAQLWIEDGLTYEAASARTGISVGALKKWAAEEGWADKRSEYRQALRDIRANTLRLRSALIAKALGSLHPQDVYAVSSIETLMSRSAGKTEAGAAPAAPENLREIKTPQQAIEAMQAAVERKINTMLASGEISLAAVRDTKQALELIEKMKAQYAPADAAADTRQRGLSEEAADEIRRKILGLS